MQGFKQGRKPLLLYVSLPFEKIQRVGHAAEDSCCCLCDKYRGALL